MLEDHLVFSEKKWRVGFGLLGQQHAESIVTHLKAHILYTPDKLRQMMVEHHLHVAPYIIAVRPPLKKKKLIDTEE